MSQCVREGCSGTYRPDGACSVCGFRAPRTTGTSSRTTTPAATAPGTTTPNSTTPKITDPVTGRSSRRTRPPVTYSVPRTDSQGSAAGRLGDSLVVVPPVPPRDPTAALLPADTEVPAKRRQCRQCHELVGQARGGKPGRVAGFCQNCGTEYSFARKLAAGDVVDGRYEVLGVLAYGGLGWIYLARHRNLGDDQAQRWVVLKGLIDNADPDAIAAALEEKRSLVEVDHPNIVTIYDFVHHPDPHTGTSVAYIVMEYLGGRSLHEIFTKYRDDNGDLAPLPLPVVLAYGLRILDALDYLHGRGLIYCDLKPENVLQVGDQLKLIDLGAVVRLANPPKAIYGTPGYQAPELESSSPSVASDLYTVGRTLAVLSFPFAGFSKEYRHSLPHQQSVPLLADEDSFYRLLCRTTDEDPGRRFGSARELRQQVYGVLCEVVGDGRAHPSGLFGPERHTFGTEAGFLGDANGLPAYGPDMSDAEIDWTAVARALPVPLVDPTDPAAPFLGTLTSTDAAGVVEAISTFPRRTPEVLLRLVDVSVAMGEPDEALEYLAEAEKSKAAGWRLDWYHGLVAMAAGRIDDAASAFEDVYSGLPGELAPKLALAVVREWRGDAVAALNLYDRVWRTDHDYLSAAFGLARLLRRVGRLEDAVAVLDDVPGRFVQHTSAQVAAIRLRLSTAQPTRTDILDASARLTRLTMDIRRTAELSVEVLTVALALLSDNGSEHDDRSQAVLGHQFDEQHLRRGLERAYRDLAKVADDPDYRSALVDRANAVRPRTLI